jgi:hypothetical protein
MADQNVRVPRRTRTGRLRVFNRALWRKRSKFTVSGLVFMAIGFVMALTGTLLEISTYSAGVLLLGFGVIIILVGIIRLLIGFISPSTPEDLIPLELQEEALQQGESVDDIV